MKNLARIVFGVIAILIAAGIAMAVWQRGRESSSAVYRTMPARRADIVAVIPATGTLVPEDVVDVGAQVNGAIAAFGNDTDGKSIDYRSSVQEGMVLARIDDALYAADLATAQAQQQQAEAQVQVAIANREQAKAKLEQASRDWDRAQRLGQSAALAQADYDALHSAYEQAVAALAVAESTIKQQEASVKMAEASVQRAQRNLAYCTIKSPVSGVIIDKRVEIGQTVVASLNAPSLFLIAKDLSRMQVLVQVNEADIGSVLPGQEVAFTTDAFGGENFQGEVRKVRLNATMTQNVVTYTVEIVTDNADLKLLPYLTANVKFVTGRHENVLAVPNAALRWSPAQALAGARPSGSSGSASGGGGGGASTRSASATVWVVSGGQPLPVQVRAGLSDGLMTEVESTEINEGTQVIIGQETASSSATPRSGGTAGGAGNTTGGETNPFAPQFPRGGRRPGGGGSGGGR